MKALAIKKRKDTKSILKRSLAIVLMVIFYIQMWASSGPGFTIGSQLYVMANSGLTLRMEPNIDSEILEIVAFGSKVQVLAQPDSTQNFDIFNWVEGRWIYVAYEGINGYMFDGYLSDLPLPIYEFEKCQLDLDLIYPLESWVDVNLGQSENSLIEAGQLTKLTNHYIGGEKMVRSQKEDNFKLELYLKDVRIMDAYHLLQSMIDSKSRLETFRDVSTFIKDREAVLHKVKVNLDNPIEIIKLISGDVKIVIRSDNYSCSL